MINVSDYAKIADFLVGEVIAISIYRIFYYTSHQLYID
jgi:hypothetical protein